MEALVAADCYDRCSRCRFDSRLRMVEGTGQFHFYRLHRSQPRRDRNAMARVPQTGKQLFSLLRDSDIRRVDSFRFMFRTHRGVRLSTWRTSNAERDSNCTAGATRLLLDRVLVYFRSADVFHAFRDVSAKMSGGRRTS